MKLNLAPSSVGDRGTVVHGFTVKVSSLPANNISGKVVEEGKKTRRGM